ncbi:MAG: helix-turn-helix domain-containing protein [Candidatus Binataceae bacterium]
MYYGDNSRKPPAPMAAQQAGPASPRPAGTSQLFSLHTQRVRVEAGLFTSPGNMRSSMLRELADLIGEEAALKLVAAFAGTRLYIPHLPQADEVLAQTIGVEAARKLAAAYGGDRVDVPNPTPRRLRIVELRSSGLSVDAIARALGCTRRRVFQVLAEVREGKAQA